MRRSKLDNFIDAIVIGLLSVIALGTTSLLIGIFTSI